jgi:hypothetical protein
MLLLMPQNIWTAWRQAEQGSVMFRNSYGRRRSYYPQHLTPLLGTAPSATNLAGDVLSLPVMAAHLAAHLLGMLKTTEIITLTDLLRLH